jgi:hypothetical protein
MGSQGIAEALFRPRGTGSTPLAIEDFRFLRPNGEEVHAPGRTGEVLLDTAWLAQLEIQSEEARTALLLGQVAGGAVRRTARPTQGSLEAGWGETASGNQRIETDLRSVTEGILRWPFWVRTTAPGQRVRVALPQQREIPPDYDLWWVDRDAPDAKPLRATRAYTFLSPRAGDLRHLELQALPRSRGTLAILQFQAQPTRGGALSIQYLVTAPCTVTATISSLSGQVVRKLAPQEAGAGLQGLAWDGKDDTGRRAPPGVYQVQIQALQEDGLPTRAVRSLFWSR